MAKNGGRAVILDASLVYIDNLQLARILKLANLRLQNISCFAKADLTRLSSADSKGMQPARPESQSICPRLMPDNNILTHKGDFVVPMHILPAEMLSKLLQQSAQGEETLKLVAQGLQDKGDTLYGLEVPPPWSVEVWCSQKAQATESILSSAQASLPERFKSADDWDYSMVKKGHPAYATTNQQIGITMPSPPPSCLCNGRTSSESLSSRLALVLYT